MSASRFSFVGEVTVGRDPDRFFREWSGKDGNSTNASINFAVKETEGNLGFVQLFGTKRSEFKVFDTDFKPMTVAWAEREDPDIMAKVPAFKKFVANLGEEFGGRHTFLTEYDMIQYLADNLPQYHGKVRVNGTWAKNIYDGKISDRFNITTVTAVTPDAASKLSLTMDFYYNSDSVDNGSLNTDGKIYVNGYVEQYIDKNTGNMFIPQTAVLSQAALPENSWLIATKYLSNYLPKKNKMGYLRWECRLVNGAEEVPFDESMLTDRQKELVELGIKTIKDFKPSGQIYGPKISEIRLTAPDLHKEFSNGMIECPQTADEFAAKIFSFAPPEELRLDTASVAADDDDDDDLF